MARHFKELREGKASKPLFKPTPESPKEILEELLRLTELCAMLKASAARRPRGSFGWKKAWAGAFKHQKRAEALKERLMWSLAA